MVRGAVDQAADLLKTRIRELEGELSKLQRALSSLTDGRQGRRGPGRPRGSSATSRTTARPRRRRRGTRADQAVRLIKANPGISASEVAKRMRIKPNYLYRVLGDLEKEGRVKKSGRNYTAA
ncbi:MAG: winged helix-turn-helix transcriptional regulator [Actinomycetota bacterium]